MALSAVIRSAESVNLNLLIDVLRGSNRAEVRDSGLDQIKTFGVGRDVPFLDWKHYITQMINQGLGCRSRSFSCLESMANRSS